MELPDLTNLTIAQVVTTTLLVAAIDVATAYVVAIIGGNFSLGVVAVWIQSHVLKRVFPILALAVVGHGVSLGGDVLVPAIPLVFASSIVALGAYILETVASIRETLKDQATPPADTTPVT